MKQARALLAFLYDFVIGDDWRIAAGVIAALIVTALLTHHATLAAWWILPAAVALLLAGTVWTVAHSRP